MVIPVSDLPSCDAVIGCNVNNLIGEWYVVSNSISHVIVQPIIANSHDNNILMEAYESIYIKTMLTCAENVSRNRQEFRFEERVFNRKMTWNVSIRVFHSSNKKMKIVITIGFECLITTYNLLENRMAMHPKVCIHE